MSDVSARGQRSCISARGQAGTDRSPVMAGEGRPSTTFLRASDKVVGGRPSPAMTGATTMMKAVPMTTVVAATPGKTIIRTSNTIRHASARQVISEIERIGTRDALAQEFRLAAERHGGVDAQPAPEILVRITIEARHVGDHQRPLVSAAACEIRPPDVV